MHEVTDWSELKPGEVIRVVPRNPKMLHCFDGHPGGLMQVDQTQLTAGLLLSAVPVAEGPQGIFRMLSEPGICLSSGHVGDYRIFRYVPAVALDPSDPFEAALIRMVEVNRKKRNDYTSAGSSPWENFDRAEEQAGTPDGVEYMIATKQARLRALGTREGGAQNESVADTKLDRAVYSVIAVARDLYPDGKVTA